MIYGLFLVSGACGLIYQVVWVRLFGLVFGNTIYASSTVLASFMAGLALGSALGSSARVKRFDGIKLYAYIELAIGVCGALMPIIVHSNSFFFTWFYQTFSPSPGLLTFVRFVISFCTLIIPAALMGATLPILSATIFERNGEFKTLTGRLYGVNTIGAFIGCYCAGYILISNFGVSITGYCAAILNGLVAVGALWWIKKSAPIDKQKVAKCQPVADEQHRRLASDDSASDLFGKALLITALLSGFASIALEVAWSKALTWIMGMDAYAFASMLSVILSGIGLGSLIYSVYIKKHTLGRNFLAVMLFLAGAAVIGSIGATFIAYDVGLSIVKRQDYAQLLQPLTTVFGAGSKDLFLGLIKACLELFLPVVIMFVPACIMGITFPAMTNLYITLKGNVAKGIGTIYSINTLGAIFGSILMGFFILPSIGLFPSIALMAGLFFICGYIMLFAGFKENVRRTLIMSGVLGLAIIGLAFVTPMDFKAIIKKTLREDSSRLDESLVYYKEGVSGDVMVKQSSSYGKEMYINGLQVASSGAHDLHSHLYPAHCIAFLKEKLDDVCLVAFGCGGTAGSLLLYDEVKHVDAVEICKGVIPPAKAYFSDMNRNVFSDPRFSLNIQDGKNFIKMTNKRYDVIYTGPIHPQSNQGSAALYTKDYFEDCRKKLKNDGLQCLWLPLHMSSATDFKTIVKTFITVYPYSALFILPNTPTSVRHVHLIGSMVPIAIDYKRVAERINRPSIAADLARLGESGFTKPYEFAVQLAMGERALAKWTDSISTLNTDDHPVVEFYNRSNSDIVPIIKAKARLLGEIAYTMEYPLSHLVSMPVDNTDSLVRELSRTYESDKALLNGHMASEYLPLFSEGSEQYQKTTAFMVRNYEKAYELMPENPFLMNFFKSRTGLEQ